MAKKTSTHRSEPLDDVLNRLSQRRWVLPSFQRDFVWTMEQIENLFNSIRLSHPFGSLLSWRINTNQDEQTLLKESFYGFIQNYHEEKSKNDTGVRKVTLLRDNDYWVVLDGQQRLTSLNIGLLGSYKKRARYMRKDNPDYPEYKLYMLVSDDVDNPFKFIRTDIINSTENFTDADGNHWVLVRRIYQANRTKDLVRTFNLSDEEEDRIDEFKSKLNGLKLDLTEITGFDYNEATQIFVKVNSGGTVLEMSDILNAIIVSTWKQVNAKEEFKELSEKVANLGFNIGTNYIVKSILFLLHSDVRFQIQGFTEFIKTVETKWCGIKPVIEDMFALLKSFGLSHSTLGSYNATLPVLYYIYHKQIKNPATAVSFKDNKSIIKNWLLSAILMKLLGGSSDTTLRTIRSAFIEKCSKKKCDDNGIDYLYPTTDTDDVLLPMGRAVNGFPADDIKRLLADDWYISEESLRKLLNTTHKGDRYSLPILSLLYPDCDLNGLNYEQDHLHPMARYDMMPDDFKADKGNKKRYDSIVNLQLLQKEINIQKGDKELKVWVDEQTKDKDKKGFLECHLIPDMSLDEADIDYFLNERETLLVKKLKKALGIDSDDTDTKELGSEMAENASPTDSSQDAVQYMTNQYVIVDYKSPYDSFAWKGSIHIEIDLNNRILKSDGWYRFGGEYKPLSTVESEEYLNFFSDRNNLIDFFDDAKAYNTALDCRTEHTREYVLRINWNGKEKEIHVGYPDVPFKHPF